MSSKASKRKQRRINTIDEEPEKKIDENVDITKDMNKSDKSDKSDKSEKDSEQGDNQEVQLIEIKENKSETDPDTPQLKPEGHNTEEEQPKVNTEIESQENVSEVLISSEKTNGQTETNIIAENGNEVEVIAPIENEQKQQPDDHNSDMEPLLIDSDDPELHFPSETGSEFSSDVDKSPVLSRSLTRRSQYRNIPTPKTPKALDFKTSGEKYLNEVRVNVTRLNIDTETVRTDDNEQESDEMLMDNAENNSFESLNEQNTESDTDVSVVVNYTGNNTTRNFDTTGTSNFEECNVPSFIETTKELSYGETLRCLTGRRPTRPVPGYNYEARLYKSNIDLSKNDQTDGRKFEAYFALPKVNLKRKLEMESQDDLKRAKRDENSGILSMFSSPFKNRINRAEISCSTPKLINFKHVEESETTIIEEVSKIAPESEEKTMNMSKKWCTIM